MEEVSGRGNGEGEKDVKRIQVCHVHVSATHSADVFIVYQKHVLIKQKKRGLCVLKGRRFR